MSEGHNMVKVSVANLIVEMRSINGERIPFVVFNPTDETKPLKPLSAGPKFPEEARNYLIKAFDADPAGFSGEDARCLIPTDMLEPFVGWLDAQFYLEPEIAVVVWDPYPELKMRLVGQYWNDILPPLNESEFDSIKLNEPRFIIQPQLLEHEDQGGNGTEVRFFMQWSMLVNDDLVFNKLKTCRAIILLDDFSLKSTLRGRQQGWCGNRVLANNVGLGC